MFLEIFIKQKFKEMGRSETPAQHQSTMAAADVDAIGAGGVTRWNHVKTFALVGVGSNNYPAIQDKVD